MSDARPIRRLAAARAAASIPGTLAALTLVVLAPAPAAGQPSEPTPWMRGFSLGVPHADGTTSIEAFTAAFHVTSVPSGALGLDFSMATLPRFLPDGVFVGVARTGLVLPIRIDPDGYLLPGLGLTTLFGAGHGGVGGMFAAHVGAALAVGPPGGLGVRFGASVFLLQGYPVWLFEMGLVGLPSRRRNRDP